MLASQTSHSHAKEICNHFFVIVVATLAVAGTVILMGGNNSNPPIISNQHINTAFDQSISDGTLRIEFSSKKFGLATNPQQIPVTSYIPFCDRPFNYCLYYISENYADTNFDSAGIKIAKRERFQGEAECLNIPPEGFDRLVKPDSTSQNEGYSTSVFSNITDAAAGNYSSGSVYRIFVFKTRTCYELQTRIGESQFKITPQVFIKEFTDTDRGKVQSLLKEVINSVSLSSGEKNLFSGVIGKPKASPLSRWRGFWLAIDCIVCYIDNYLSSTFRHTGGELIILLSE